VREQGAGNREQGAGNREQWGMREKCGVWSAIKFRETYYF